MHKSFPFQCIFSVSLPTFRKGVHCTKVLHPLTHAVQCAVRFSTLCACCFRDALLGFRRLSLCAVPCCPVPPPISYFFNGKGKRGDEHDTRVEPSGDRAGRTTSGKGIILAS